jgi:DNA-binding NtrC family response regulator
MILIIDDDKVSRKIIAACLDRLSLKSVQCENGREAWELLWESNDVNLVITDMVMPDMDGKELIQLIREQDELKKLPVIMISGVLGAVEIAPIMESSPAYTFFLEKPLDIDLLEKHLQAIGVREGAISYSSSSAH